MDVLGRVLGRESDLDFDLVARLECHPCRNRLQRETADARRAPEIAARHGEEVAAVFLRELLRRKMPRRRGEGESLALLLHGHPRSGLRVELFARDYELVLPARVAIRIEDERRPLRPYGHGRLLADGERSLSLQVVDERIDHLGGCPRGL